MEEKKPQKKKDKVFEERFKKKVDSGAEASELAGMVWNMARQSLFKDLEWCRKSLEGDIEKAVQRVRKEEKMGMYGDLGTIMEFVTAPMSVYLPLEIIQTNLLIYGYNVPMDDLLSLADEGRFGAMVVFKDKKGKEYELYSLRSAFQFFLRNGLLNAGYTMSKILNDYKFTPPERINRTPEAHAKEEAIKQNKNHLTLEYNFLLKYANSYDPETKKFVKQNYYRNYPRKDKGKEE